MSKIRYSSVALMETTNAQGIARFDFKIPGTFGGFNPWRKNSPHDGRLLKELLVWSSAPVAGDRIFGIKVEDTDAVIPAAQQGAISAYPILYNYEDLAIPQSAGVDRGSYIPLSKPLLVSLSTLELDFIPSGCHFIARVAAGSGVAGIKIFANLVLGRVSRD
jgi:hypothetical protein